MLLNKKNVFIEDIIEITNLTGEGIGKNKKQAMMFCGQLQTLSGLAAR